RFLFFFFFNDTATTEIYTLSLHDALPIDAARSSTSSSSRTNSLLPCPRPGDRKSTRLNSSHRCISYAVFCLKKKKNCMLVESSEKKQRKLLVGARQERAV